MTMAHGQAGAEIAADRTPTLTCNHEAPIAFHPTQVQHIGIDIFNAAMTGDVAVPLTHRSDGTGTGPTVMVGSFKPGQSAAARSIGYENEMAPSLEAGGGGNNKPAVHIGMQVRRLTPVECERLQGFPDNYTHIKDKCPDGPRYKALGNSWAVPVVRWIGKRIQEHINAP